MKHAMNGQANNNSICPHEAQTAGLFSGRLEVEDPVIGSSCSSRIYYRAVGQVPFQWESQPGKPKDLPASDPIPPLSPPPAMQSAQLARRCRLPREPPAGSLWLWLWTAPAPGGGGRDTHEVLKAKPFSSSSDGKRTSNGVSSSCSSHTATAATTSSLLPTTWDGFFLPLETNDANRSPADEAGCVCQRWSFSRLLVCLNRGF